MTYKIDEKYKIKENHVSYIHEYNIDLKTNQIYLMDSDIIDYDAYEIGPITSEQFIKNINLCMRNSDNDGAILIHMDTNGGDVESGLSIFSAIKSSPRPVSILVYSKAYSMGAYILQAANKRILMPNAKIMLHDGSTAIGGTLKQARTLINQVNDYDKIYYETIIDRMISSPKSKFYKQKRSKVKKWLKYQLDKKEDFYVTAKEAIEYGLADEIFGVTIPYNWGKLVEYEEWQLEL